MKGKLFLIGGTILVSFLVSLSLGAPADDASDVEFGIEEEEGQEEVDDFSFEDPSYDYQEVVGEEAPKDVIPFQKYPGVYILDLEGVLYALDTDNGDILWARKVSDKLIRVTEAPPPPPHFPKNTSLQGRLFCVSS